MRLMNIAIVACKWSEEDKANQSERTISPALQQAVESSVAEIEEATFGRGAFNYR